MVSHLFCQVDEAGCILVKQNEIVQESWLTDKSYLPEKSMRTLDKRNKHACPIV